MDAFMTDGAATSIAMRATAKGRDQSLVEMVLGDRGDASVMSHLENLKAEMWAYQTLTNADRVRFYNAIRAFGG